VTILLLFIGYPRSGHTLVSSLLDAHPHAAVANEYALIRRWRYFADSQKTRKFVIEELFRDSVMQSKVGYRSPTMHRTFNYSVPNQWNGRVRDYLQVVGDKHGPLTTKYLSDLEGRYHMQAMTRLLNITVRILHVIRHPMDNIATMAIREGHDRKFIQTGQVLNDITELRHQIHMYFKLARLNVRLLQKQQDYQFKILNVYIEDLIANPKAVLSSICGFLHLRCSSSYLTDCSSRVLTNTSNTRNNVVWGNLTNAVFDEMKTIPFLQRYIVR
jgi:hypothetical protein